MLEKVQNAASSLNLEAMSPTIRTYYSHYICLGNDIPTRLAQDSINACACVFDWADDKYTLHTFPNHFGVFRTNSEMA